MRATRSHAGHYEWEKPSSNERDQRNTNVRGGMTVSTTEAGTRATGRGVRTNGKSNNPCRGGCMTRSTTEASRLATGLSSRKTEKSKILCEFQQKNTFPSSRPHDKNLDPARTFAVRRLRGSPLACTVARYLIRVLTGARRKRIGISLKKIIRRPEKSYIRVNLFFANCFRATKECCF
jgi:hypothetical protein